MSAHLHLVFPMFAMVILTYVVAGIMLKTRVQAVREGMDVRYFKTYNHGQPPEQVLRVDRHYTNLFELPLLFYVGCTVAMLVSATGFWINFWAWLFVIARVLHAFIHIRTNKIPHRMRAFGLGALAILGLWIQIIISVL